MGKLQSVKCYRWARKYLCFYFKDTFAPLLHRDSLIQFTASIVLFYLIYSYRGFLEMAKEVADWVTWQDALFHAFLFWMVVNLLLVVWKVKKQEDDLGRWYGNRFQYNEPQRILTVLVTPDKEYQCFDFAIKDAEKNALVNFITDTDGRKDLIGIGLGFSKANIPFGNMYFNSDGKQGLKIPDKRGRLFTKIAPESVPITVKLFMTSWEIQCQRKN